MPIYEYRCQECSSAFEVLTSFAERDRGQACPRCESAKTRVMVSSFAMAGSGESEPVGFGTGGGGGGCACGGACSCGGHN